MGQPCSICIHPKRLDIDKAIVSGLSVRQVAARLAKQWAKTGETCETITSSAVFRHIHHGDTTGISVAKRAASVAKQAKELLESVDLVKESRTLRAEVKELGQEARRAGEYGPAVSAVVAGFKGIETEAKLTGAFAPVKTELSGQVGVVVLPSEDREWVAGQVVETVQPAELPVVAKPATAQLEPADPLLIWWQRWVPRGHLVITGHPRCGKSTLATELGRRLAVEVLRTDDLAELGWGADSDKAAEWMGDLSRPWIIEGCAAVRSLRKVIKAGGHERPVVIYLDQALIPLTPGQKSLARGIQTIWETLTPAVDRIQAPGLTR